ncbi:hypothetical protein Glove_49g16 [Diversispora epigaea]|uniref:Uncharacterized protein n=1 Tax=Diversispora epigaea TaxID=1348612 RepID=A0A397JIE7_9GLOM|nr:hypothetical protein Glove_49g16 [Diversispora epigaea]
MSTQSEHDTPTVSALSVSIETPIPENLEQCEDTYAQENFDPGEEEESNRGSTTRGPTPRVWPFFNHGFRKMERQINYTNTYSDTLFERAKSCGDNQRQINKVSFYFMKK